MDVFSAGCVIAEIFHNGAPTLDLPTLLAMSHGEKVVVEDLPAVAALEPPALRVAVARMLDRDPAKRGAAREHLDALVAAGALPVEFTGFVYSFFKELLLKAHGPDDRVALVCRRYGRAVREMAGVDDAAGARFLRTFAVAPRGDAAARDVGGGFSESDDDDDDDARGAESASDDDDRSADEAPARPPFPKPTLDAATLESRFAKALETSGDAIFDLPLEAFAFPDDGDDCDGLADVSTEELCARTERLLLALERGPGALAALPELPTRPDARARPAPAPAAPTPKPGGGSLILLAQLVCASARHARFPRTKLAAVALLLRFGASLDDEARLQRLVPHVAALVDDGSALVRAACCRALAALVASVRSFGASDAALFPKYVFPLVSNLVGDPEACVVVAFAECAGSFATSAKRFLDIAAERRRAAATGGGDDDDDAAPAGDAYGRDLDELRQRVRRWVVVLLSEASSLAKHVLISDLPRLCVFFGREQTRDVLMPHLITFLNDSDWGLRDAFCAHVAAVGAFLGPDAAEGLILPCIGQALVDTEPLVIARALASLASLVELGLLSRAALVEMTGGGSSKVSAAPLLLHPSPAVRLEAASLFAAAALAMPTAQDADAQLFEPVLAPFLATPLGPAAPYHGGAKDLLGRAIVACLRPPLSPALYREALHGDGPPGASLAPDDAAALELARGYLAVASRHAKNRLATWQREGKVDERPAPPAGDRDAARGGPRVGGRVPPPKLSAAQAQALLVPDMKFVALMTSVSVGGADDPAGDDAAIRRRYGVLDSRRPDARDVGSLDADDLLAAAGPPGPGSGAAPPPRADDDAPPPPRPRPRRDPNALTPLARRAEALDVPPLPPELGCLRQPGDDRPFSWYATPLRLDDPNRRAEWRPKAGVLIATFGEHAGAVQRLAVAQDQSFFVSASDDGTAKVWTTRGLDKEVCHASAATYAGHGAGEKDAPALMDCCAVDNARSVATAAADGEVHVWRVDLAQRTVRQPEAVNPITGGRLEEGNVMVPGVVGGAQKSTRSVLGADASLVRRLGDGSEGAAVTVNHFNDDVGCVVVYGTAKGRLHAVDLRAKREAFRLVVPPELGLLTATALGTDKAWCAAGTATGFVCLWDLRYAVLNAVWRHSAKSKIHRLATCARLPGSPPDAPPSPLAFVAAGGNEVAVWDLHAGGACKQCFRAMPPLDGDPQTLDREALEKRWKLPTLQHIDVPAHPKARLFRVDASMLPRPLGREGDHSMRAIMGRISNHGNSYLITGGTDTHIRYWDFTSPRSCYTVSGPHPGMPRPTYDAPAAGDGSAFFVCTDHRAPPTDALDPADAPHLMQRGPVAPPSAHKDAVLDLKSIDLPLKLMLSSSRDGVVKCWR